MKTLKRYFKQNTHNFLFKALAGFGRSFNRFYENRNHDIYSNGESFILKKLSTLKPAVILDVGANVGNWGILASETCTESRVYCFEPVPDTYQKLIAGVERSGLKNIIPVNAGLYKETTTFRINRYASNEHSSIYDVQGAAYAVNDVIEIDLINGDAFLKKHNIEFIDFLKLDVEGAEMDALTGLENALSENKIRLIQFEYGYINITTKILLIDFYKMLTKHGYLLGKLYPKGVEFREYSYKHEDFIGPNFIAVRKSDHEMISLLS
jgi:FkbM family methyltransferase